MTAKLFVILMVVTLPIVTAFGMRSTQATHGVIANIQCLHYLDAGLPEQYVFIDPIGERPIPPAPDFLGPYEILVPNVIRMEGNSALTSTNLDTGLYVLEIIVPRNLFKIGSNPTGPYNKGDRLNMTLRQWLTAVGSGRYGVTCEDATLDLTLYGVTCPGNSILAVNGYGMSTHLP